MYVVGKPKIFNTDRLKDKLNSILSSGQLTNFGPFEQKLEDYFIQKFQLSSKCVAVANATLGLELAIQALGLPPNSRIAVPSFTFIASVSTIERCGHVPVFVDIEDDYCISIDHSKQQKDLAAILVVNTFSNICNFDELYKFNLPIIVDSAHALGAGSMQYKVGELGAVEVLSGHATKIAGAGEAGLVTSKDTKLLQKIKYLKNFGFDLSKTDVPDIEELGTNAKLNEIMAATFLNQLEDYEFIQQIYEDNYLSYKQLLPKEIKLINPNTPYSNYSYITCQHPNADYLVEELKAEGVCLAKKYFYPIHKYSYFQKKYGNIDLPNTENIYKEVFCLPTGLTIGVNQIKFISQKIKRALV